MQQKIISVLGAGNCQSDDPRYQLAEHVGQLLAEKGLGIATGGYGGVMEATSKGAFDWLEKNPLAPRVPIVGYTMQGREPNEYIQKFTKTGEKFGLIGDCARQAHFTGSVPPVETVQFGIRLGSLLSHDGFIVIAGKSMGTLLEVFSVAHLLNRGLLKKSMYVLSPKPYECEWTEKMFELIGMELGIQVCWRFPKGEGYSVPTLSGIPIYAEYDAVRVVHHLSLQNNESVLAGFFDDREAHPRNQVSGRGETWFLELLNVRRSIFLFVFY